MKQVIIKIILIVLTILLIIGLFHKIHNLNTQLSYSINNEQAYALENSRLNDENLVFRMTCEQLEYSQDSLMQQMLLIAEENNIKTSRITQLQFQLENIYKRDSIIIRDTIFIDPDFTLDTCIRNEWSSTQLNLSYPGNIFLEQSFRNEKYIIVSSKRELIKPSKCFLKRWFGKKHTILEIEVVDLNPYVETERQRFVEIIE